MATATVERAFSAMNIVKKKLQNEIRGQWMNDYLVTFFEKEVFCNVPNDLIIRRFQDYYFCI